MPMDWLQSETESYMKLSDENGRKTSQPFSISTFEYENESGKPGHENEYELTEYQKFRKRTNSSRIKSNMVGIRKINTEY